MVTRKYVCIFFDFNFPTEYKIPKDENQLVKANVPVSDAASPVATRPVTDPARRRITDTGKMAKRPVSDAAKPVRLRMNRRRCSGGRRRRRKGRACRPRVWTEYFTKLE